MTNKDYTYEVLGTVGNKNHLWVYLRVVSEWNDSDVIHQRESKGWVCLNEAFDSKAVWSPVDDDKYLPVENAVYALDKAAELLAESKPINTKDVYGYLKNTVGRS